MQKTSVFQAASFGDLLLNEKQKKPFVSLIVVGSQNWSMSQQKA